MGGGREEAQYVCAPRGARPYIIGRLHISPPTIRGEASRLPLLPATGRIL